jgi:hypothetical protein
MDVIWSALARFTKIINMPASAEVTASRLAQKVMCYQRLHPHEILISIPSTVGHFHSTNRSIKIFNQILFGVDVTISVIQAICHGPSFGQEVLDSCRLARSLSIPPANYTTSHIELLLLTFHSKSGPPSPSAYSHPIGSGGASVVVLQSPRPYKDSVEPMSILGCRASVSL